MKNQHKISTKDINIRYQHSSTKKCIHHEISISIHPITMIIQLRQDLVLSQLRQDLVCDGFKFQVESIGSTSAAALSEARRSWRMVGWETLELSIWEFPWDIYIYIWIYWDFTGIYGISWEFIGILWDFTGLDRDSQDFNGFHGIDMAIGHLADMNGIDWDLKIDSMMGSMGFNESIGQSMKQSYVKGTYGLFCHEMRRSPTNVHRDICIECHPICLDPQYGMDDRTKYTLIRPWHIRTVGICLVFFLKVCKYAYLYIQMEAFVYNVCKCIPISMCTYIYIYIYVYICKRHVYHI